MWVEAEILIYSRDSWFANAIKHFRLKSINNRKKKKNFSECSFHSVRWRLQIPSGLRSTLYTHDCIRRLRYSLRIVFQLFHKCRNGITVNILVGFIARACNTRFITVYNNEANYSQVGLRLNTDYIGIRPSGEKTLE